MTTSTIVDSQQRQNVVRVSDLIEIGQLVTKYLRIKFQLRSSSAHKDRLDVSNSNYRSLPRSNGKVAKPSGLVDEVLSVCMQKWSALYGSESVHKSFDNGNELEFTGEPVEPQTPKATPSKNEMVVDFPTPTPSSPILAAGHRIKVTILVLTELFQFHSHFKNKNLAKSNFKEFMKRRDKTETKKKKTSDLRKQFLQQNSVEEPCR